MRQSICSSHLMQSRLFNMHAGNRRKSALTIGGNNMLKTLCCGVSIGAALRTVVFSADNTGNAASEGFERLLAWRV